MEKKDLKENKYDNLTEEEKEVITTEEFIEAHENGRGDE